MGEVVPLKVLRRRKAKSALTPGRLTWVRVGAERRLRNLEAKRDSLVTRMDENRKEYVDLAKQLDSLVKGNGQIHKAWAAVRAAKRDEMAAKKARLGNYRVWWYNKNIIIIVEKFGEKRRFEIRRTSKAPLTWAQACRLALQKDRLYLSDQRHRAKQKAKKAHLTLVSG